MASTYVNNLRLNEMATGDASGTWGTTTNTNLELIGEALGYGTEAITTNADTHTSTVADGSSDAARAMYVKYTGTLDSTCTITIAPNTMKRVQIIENATSGSQSIIISQGSGASVTIPTGRVSVVYLDGAGSGAAVVNAFTDLDLAGTLSIAGAVAAATDMTVGDDLTLSSDAGVLGFGADTDVTLTHVADTGLLLNSSRQLQFGDSGTYIHQSADGVLDLVADTEIEINATTIDINGAVDISGNALVSGEVQTANIGYTDGDNAITIADGGGITAANGITSTAAANTLGATSFNDADITNVGDIQLDSITGDGDTNTSITFSGSDVITVATGGSTSFTVNADQTTSFSAGATITVADNSDNLTLTSTDADANVGPNLNLYRNSGSPADDDVTGVIVFNGRNDNSQDVIYARQLSYIKDASDGTEDGQLTLQTMVAGTIRDRLNITPAEIVLNEDSVDVDFRVESNGNTNMIFVDAGNDHVNIGTSTDLGGVLNVHSDDNTDTLVAYSSDADSNEGPVVRLWRNSASPADGDNIGYLYYTGENSADEKINYVELLGSIEDVTNATEDGVFNIQTMVAGTARSRILVDSTGIVLNDASQDLDFRVESNGNANMFFVDAYNDKVGVGTNSPSGTMEVRMTHTETDVTTANSNETLVLGNTGAGDGIYNALRFGGNQQDMYIMSFNDSTQADRRLGFFVGSVAGDAAGDERFTILGNGFLGINNTAPESVSGAAGPVLRMSGSNPEIVFDDTNGTANQLGLYYLNYTLQFHSPQKSGGAGSAMSVNVQSGNVNVAGALSKGSGSFRIDHPLEAKKDTHNLIHSFIEGPQADLIYRGKVNLVDGAATVNLDVASGMTEGTFVLLNTNTQCFTSNESGWTAVKGSVSGNTLTITSEVSCTDTISWMVVGERHDQHMKDTDWTDSNGKVIVEPLKEEE